MKSLLARRQPPAAPPRVLGPGPRPRPRSRARRPPAAESSLPAPVAARHRLGHRRRFPGARHAPALRLQEWQRASEQNTRQVIGWHAGYCSRQPLADQGQMQVLAMRAHLAGEE